MQDEQLLTITVQLLSVILEYVDPRSTKICSMLSLCLMVHAAIYYVQYYVSIIGWCLEFIIAIIVMQINSNRALLNLNCIASIMYFFNSDSIYTQSDSLEGTKNVCSDYCETYTTSTTNVLVTQIF